MSFNLAMLLASIVYLLLVSGFFFFRKKVTNQETKTYAYLLISDFFLIVFEFLCVLSAKFDKTGSTPLAMIVCRGLLVAIVLWITIFTLYIILVTKKVKSDNIFLNHKGLFITIFIINTLLVCLLPIYFYTDGVVAYTYGASTTYLVGLIFLASIINIYCAIRSRKYLQKKKILPIFAFILSIITLIMIRSVAPQVQMFSAIFTFITILMYFTIENPDVKMIEELIKSQKLSEKTTNEKSKFLSTVSSDIENRIDKMDEIYTNLTKTKNKEERTYYLDALKNVLDNSRNMLKRTIDVSNMDIKHLSITNNKYNIKSLLESTFNINKKEIKNNIDYRLNIGSELPNELYGDQIKLKQILTTVLSNSIKYTKEGFIELRVNSIIKNDICRLIISVEDSGVGIDIFKQNEIMNNHDELDDKDLETLDKMDLNLKIVRKLINIIGGTFTIDNNKYGGTTINISLDQKIVEEYQDKEIQKFNEYSNAIKKELNSAVISLNKDNNKIIKNICKKNNYNCDEYLITKECLDKVRNGYNYDLIIIDEYMEKINARSLLKKLKEISYKGKILIISKNKDINNKKELLSLGFSGIIYLPINKKELNDKIKNN